MDLIQKVIKQRYRLIKANKKLPCRNCLVFPICKPRYLNILHFTKGTYFNFTIDGNAVRLQRLIDRCNLIKEWYDTYSIDKIFLYPEDKELMTLVYNTFIKKKPISYINRVKTKIRKMLTWV